MKNRKKLIIIISSLLGVILVVGIILGIKYLFDEKEDDMISGMLNKVDISDDGIANVKANVVKVINKFDKHEIVGSGFFVDSGYIVTNSHVVDIKGEITVEYSDGTKSSATLISNDITSDVALISVDKISALAMNFGNTLNVSIAEDLYSVGYAMNLEGESSVTKGILSARRSIAGIEYLQTDAAINSGFSGGPLLSSDGYVMGMNSLANDNATIGMAISSESLQNIIDKLIDNKKVVYLESDRPTNALSSILKEVGYDNEDIYDEWEYFHEGEEKLDEEEEDDDDENKEVVEVYQKSANCELKSMSVEGYNLNWNGVDQKVQLYLINDEASIKVNVVPKDSKATYTIEGADNIEYRGDMITITITAEDKIHKKQYWINVHRLKSTIDGLAKIEVGGGPRMSDGKKEFSFSWNYFDSDSFHLYGSSVALSSVDVNLYVCKVGSNCSSEEDKRLLKSFSSFPPKYEADYVKLPLSEVKNLLTEEDFNENNEANLMFDLTLTTKSQGTFSNSSSIITVNK